MHPIQAAPLPLPLPSQHLYSPLLFLSSVFRLLPHPPPSPVDKSMYAKLTASLLQNFEPVPSRRVYPRKHLGFRMVNYLRLHLPGFQNSQAWETAGEPLGVLSALCQEGIPCRSVVSLGYRLLSHVGGHYILTVNIARVLTHFGGCVILVLSQVSGLSSG